ncbi:MAG TPA: hypothetical protein DG757_07140 [Bacillus sp. (in: Bacteria)]|nr:hypothetical protein [Bacillus sp. (in: firmicutes)]
MSTLEIQKDKIRLNKVTHTVRSSQVVLQYGVGAMIDFPDQTLMTAAPEYWNDQIEIIQDERLEKALNVDYFGMPKGADQFTDGISFVRFPEWYFCPKCRRFQPIRKWYKEYSNKTSARKKEKDPYMRKPKCLECKQDLVAARIVVACENGHIDDFPWVKWVHRRNLGGKKIVCNNPELTFQTGATATAGLEGLVVQCKSCKAKATLKDAFDPEIFQKLDGRKKDEDSANMSDDFACSGLQPWKHSKEACEKHPRAMQRGASSIYFPNTVSSLVIPPYSDRITIEIESSEQYKSILSFLEEIEEDERDAEVLRRLDKWSKNIALQKSLNKEAVSKIIERKFLSQEKLNEYTTSSVKYRAEEYEALNGEIPITHIALNDFQREEKDVNEYAIFGLKKLSLIKKVREVRALTGFTRIKSPGATDLGGNYPGFVAVKEPETRWFPACEVRGEGIFFEFNHKVIEKWVSKNPDVNERAAALNHSYSQTYQATDSARFVTPKFILLHTVAHLLMRQLSFECGYSIASLRERLYCSEEDDGKVMSGILIYTASGDSEGTLGGLVRQGYPDSLPRIFKKAIQSAIICSNDPVCISSNGQGRDALNLAACHTCTLLPETSCEEFNVFLDRAMVVGTFDNPRLGFFRNWIESV